MIKSLKSKLFASAKAPALLSAAAMALAGCVSPVAGPSGLYATPIGNAPVTPNPTPYSEALVCLGDFARANSVPTPRIAVGRILDYTGKADIEGGREVTQGASLMAISAFAKAGARLVERFDTSVSELELKYANNKLITDSSAGEFRKITAGSIPGSDFHLIGGITELNSNIRSSGIDAFIGDVDPNDAAGTFTGNLFVINIGMDLRLVETQTLEVVDVISYQKQIIGREVSAGIFDFMNNNVFDIGAGERAQEPLQLAVRSVVERAVLEMTANLYGMPEPAACLTSDPLGPPTTGITGGFTPAYPETLVTNNAATRESTSRWNVRRDQAIKSALRGRQ